MSKKTKWYPADVRPIHEGLYETRVEGGLTWSVWMDGRWHFATDDAELSVERAALGDVSFWQKREWRGLTAPK